MSEPRRLEPSVWEIPVGYVAGMRVPGVVFATDVDGGGVVSPGGVGFDIGCGVRLLRSDLDWDRDVRGRIGELVHTLARRIPRGPGGAGLLPLDRAGVDRVLVEGVRYPLARGVGVEEDAAACEDGGTVPAADPAQVSDRAYQRGAPQLGSLGGGNHFLEVQVVDQVRDAAAAAAMGLEAGQVCLMLHTGSRGIGHQTCPTATGRSASRSSTRAAWARSPTSWPATAGPGPARSPPPATGPGGR